MVSMHDGGYVLELGNFSKLLTPLMGDLIFNPGGKHGLFVVQRLEDIMGPPGLTAILLIVAVAFLTYLTTETITVIRKALNPIGFISKRVSFEITNHKKDEEEPVTDEAEDNQAEPVEEEDEDMPSTVLEEFKDPEPAQVIDLDVNPEEGLKKDENTQAENPIEEKSLLEKQRELRAQKAEQEAKDTNMVAGGNIDMDISIAAADEKAHGTVVSNVEHLNTPINPKEPFTKYKYPTLSLLKKYEDNGNYIDEAEQIANKTASSRCWATLVLPYVPYELRWVLPSHSMRYSLPKVCASLKSRISRTTSP